jgi:adenine-specific DNA-methyltransferase
MYNKRDEHFSSLGPYATWPLDTTSMDTRENLRFQILHQGIEIWPKKQWLWSRDRVTKAQSENKLVFNFNEREQTWSVRFKGYLLDGDGEEKLGKPTTMVLDILTQEGTKDFAEFFPREVFQFPKPVKLIKNFLSIETTTKRTEPEIVLDFFAGSGTTAQAVLERSIEDSRNRRFITVQLPEPLIQDEDRQDAAAKICKDIGVTPLLSEIAKERVRRVSTKIKSENPMFPGDAGFRVFKLDTSNIRAWSPDRDDLEGSLLANIEHIQPGRSDADVLYELLLKLGFDLCVPIEARPIAGKTVHSIGGGVLMACLDPRIAVTEAETLALGMAAWRKEQAPVGETTAVFRDSAFENDVAKSNLAAILQQHGIAQVRSL